MYFIALERNITNYTPRCEIKDTHNVIQIKLIHRPEEGLDLKLELVLYGAPIPRLKLWFTNNCEKVVLNEKTINGLRVCSQIFHLLIQVCGSLPH